MEKKKVEIEEQAYLYLLESYYKLQALEDYGVDNWQWYDWAFSDWIAEYNQENETNFKTIYECVEDMYNE